MIFIAKILKSERQMEKVGTKENWKCYNESEEGDQT